MTDYEPTREDLRRYTVETDDGCIPRVRRKGAIDYDNFEGELDYGTMDR